MATKFRGRAAAWWQQLKQSHIRQGKSKINTWENFLKHMHVAFLPHNYMRTLYQQLHNLRQGTQSIDEYTREFHQLVTRVDLANSEDQLVSRYIGGMRQQFQDTLNLFDPIYVFEAHQRALHLEKTMNRRTNMVSNSSGNRLPPVAPPYGATT